MRDLLQKLEERGVQLAVKEGQLVARARQAAVTPELAEQIKTHKDELLKVLQTDEGSQHAPLPETLVRLVRAAAGNHLNYPGF